MKRRLGFLVLLAFVIPSVLFTGCKKKPVTEQKEPIASKETDTEVLFSFDSYEEITRAGLKIGGHFGETKINTDKTFITEGKGSWMMRPQGDYGKEGNYPSFRLRCTESTFVKSDFNSYDKLYLDIYNDSKETVKMEFTLSANNSFDSYDSGETVIWTLEPNAWTKCEYDLSGDEYSAALDLTEVRYINVTILSKKESKDDTMPTLYLDNLRGHLAEEERTTKEFDENFREKVTFDDVLERYLFLAGTVGNNKMTLSRVVYENSVIGTQGEEFGTYGLQGAVNGAIWPSYTFQYNEELKAGTIVSFQIYVAADETLYGDMGYHFEAGSGSRMFNGKLQFNRWETVEFELTKDLTSTWSFLNFDNGTGSSMFGSTPVTLFMDNFQIIKKPEVDFTKGVDLEEPAQRFSFNNVSLVEYEKSSIGKQSSTFGKYGLKRDATKFIWPSFTVNFDKIYTKGTRFRFMVYVEVDEKLAKNKGYYMGSWDIDVMSGKLEFNKWQVVEAVLKKDVSMANLFVNLDNGNEKNMFGTEPVTAYFDNFYMIELSEIKKNNNFTEGITFEDTTKEAQYLFTNTSLVKYADTTLGAQGDAYGTYGLKRDATGYTWPTFTANFEKKYAKGDIVSFMLYVEVDESLAQGKNYYIESYGGTVSNSKKEFNRWVEVEVPLKEAADSIGMFLNFDDGNEKNMFGKATLTVYMDNFKIISPSEVKENNDFSKGITFENPSSGAKYLFTNTSLVKYADTTLGAQGDAYGTYGLKRDATGYTWPTFTANFEKKYAKGDIVSFMLYVEVDESLAQGRNYYIESYGGTVSNSKKEFNRWVEVEVPLKEAADSIGMFLNFDDGNEKNMFGKATLTAYMDNFKIISPSEVKGNNDFSKGITFEDPSSGAKYLFTNTSLVKYADTTLNAQGDAYGTYGLKRDATGYTWPTFTANFEKKYAKGDIVSFMLYVEVDESLAQGKNYYIESYGGTVSNSKKEFNRWVEVEVPLKEAADSIGMFLNFDGGDGKSMFGSATVTAYMDNFIIYESAKSKSVDFEKGVTFEDRLENNPISSYGLARINYAETTIGEQCEEYGSYGVYRENKNTVAPSFTVTYDKTYPAGSYLTFMMYVEVDEALATSKHYFISADGGTELTGKVTTLNQWVKGVIKLNQDSSSTKAYFNFNDGYGNNLFGSETIKIYLDDFLICDSVELDSADFSKGVTFEKMQDASTISGYGLSQVNYAETTIGIQNAEYGACGMSREVVGTAAAWPSFTITYDKEYPAGSYLTFMMYVEVDTELAKGKWYSVDSHGNRQITGTVTTFNQWVKGIIQLNNNASSTRVFFNFDNDGSETNVFGNEKIKVYLDNFLICDSLGEQNADFSKGIAFENEQDASFISGYGLSRVKYEETTIGLQDAPYGVYGMSREVTGVGAAWPSFTITYDKEYPAGSYLSFMMYIEADESLVEGKWYGVDSHGNTQRTGTVTNFNQWVKGVIQLSNASSSTKVFFNFDNDGSGKNVFGNETIKVYLDNIKVSESE